MASYSDAQCTQLVQSATTDENGHAAFASVPTGNYYVHEIHPSKGYLLDEQIYPVSVSAGSNSAGAWRTRRGGAGKRTGRRHRAEARRQDGRSGTGQRLVGRGAIPPSPTTGTPRGMSRQPASNLGFCDRRVSRVATYSSSQLVSGDQLFANSQGEAVFPLGTYGITETKAPEDYALTDSSTHVAVVTLENGTAIWKSLDGWNNTTAVKDVQGRGVSDEVLLGSIHVGKIDRPAQEGSCTGRRPPWQEHASRYAMSLITPYTWATLPMPLEKSSPALSS